MPPALKVKTLGLPRWAWLLVIAGGVTIGVIIRNREKAAQSAANTQDQQCDPTDPNGGCYDPSCDPTDPNSQCYDPSTQFAGVGSDTTPAFSVPNTGGTYPSGSGSPITINVGQPDGSTGDTSGGSCGKKPGYKLPKGLKWECRDGRWVQSGQPVNNGGGQGHNCSHGEHWDPHLHRCVAHGGTHQGGTGHHRNCPPGQHLAPDGKTCVKDHPHGKPPNQHTVVTGGGPPTRRDVHTVA